MKTASELPKEIIKRAWSGDVSLLSDLESEITLAIQARDAEWRTLAQALADTQTAEAVKQRTAQCYEALKQAGSLRQGLDDILALNEPKPASPFGCGCWELIYDNWQSRGRGGYWYVCHADQTHCQWCGAKRKESAK